MAQEHAGGLIPEFTIADRLKLARELSGLDQDGLAALTDTSRSTIRNYENRRHTGKRKILVLKQWALATGVNLGWLETGAGDPTTTPPPDGEPAGDHDAALAKLAGRKRAHRGAPRTNHRYAA